MAVSIIAQPKKKKNTDLQATIYIRGYYNRKPVASISTGQKINIEHWDPVNRRLLTGSPNAKLVNAVIEIKLQQMHGQLLKKEIMGTSINRQHVAKAVRNVDDSKDFLLFCKDRITLYNNKETKRTYNSEVTKLEQFQQLISFSDIDYHFLQKYKAYMQQILNNKDNTVWKSFKFINTMINHALKCGGIIECNPFADFSRGTYTQTSRNFLDISHCDKIMELTGNENEMIRKVSIYFLLMSYSGMRFSDAMQFNPDRHVVDGERIVMDYQKFDTNVNNKMFKRLKVIVDLVRTNRLNTSNKTFNQWLKIIAATCNIKINLSAHVGRHTMGGILAEMEIPEEQARIILGQKDIRSTRIYYHIKNKNIDKAMDTLNTL